jgi:hypothetical protein
MYQTVPVNVVLTGHRIEGSKDVEWGRLSARERRVVSRGVACSLHVLIIAFNSNRIHSILIYLLLVIFSPRSPLGLFSASALPPMHVKSSLCIMHSCVEIFRSEL